MLFLLLPDETHLDQEIKAAINLQTSFTHLSLFHYFWKTNRENNYSSAYYYCSYYNNVGLKKMEVVRKWPAALLDNNPAEFLQK